MNTKALRKIQMSILREPKRYNQEDWAGKKGEVSKDGSCGTVGCIGGWACANELGIPEYNQKYIFGNAENRNVIEIDACDYLDITYDYNGMSGRLFHSNLWHPILKFFFVRKGWGNLKGNRFWRAIGAVVRIEVFIWSNGKV